MSDLESRMLALLRYALDNPSETFRKADGMQWLGEASELVTVLEKPQQFGPMADTLHSTRTCDCACPWNAENCSRGVDHDGPHRSRYSTWART